MGSGNNMNGREQKFTQDFHFNIILPSMPRSSKCSLSLRFPRSCSNFNIHFNIILPSIPRSSKYSVSLRFPHHAVCAPLLSPVLFTRPALSFVLSAPPNNFRSGVRPMKLILRLPIILNSNSLNKGIAVRASSAVVTVGCIHSNSGEENSFHVQRPQNCQVLVIKRIAKQNY